jgi:hypothetical protein
MPPAPELAVPVAVGLMLCDQVIVDKDTYKPSPLGIFTGLAVADFAESQRFSAFAVLTNGRGEATLELVVFRLDSGDQIYSQRFATTFPDPLAVVNINIRIRRIRFPAAGWYDFVLCVNSQHVCQRRIRVYLATSVV